MQITLSTEEAQVLLNLIDIAVKATGLQAAEAALHFQKLISAAAQSETQVPLPEITN